MLLVILVLTFCGWLYRLRQYNNGYAYKRMIIKLRRIRKKMN